MKIKLFLQELTENSSYTFLSVQEDYNASSVEAFNLIDFLCRKGIIEEKETAFLVVCPPKKLTDFKTDFALSEDYGKFSKEIEEEEIQSNAISENNEDENDDDWLFDDTDDNEDVDFSHDFDDSDIIYNIDQICQHNNTGNLLPLKDGYSILLQVANEDGCVDLGYINVKNSIIDFICDEIIENNRLLIYLFEDPKDHYKFISQKKDIKCIDTKRSTFSYGSPSNTVCFLKWDKPIVKQKKSFAKIIDSICSFESCSIVINLKIKKKN